MSSFRPTVLAPHDDVWTGQAEPAPAAAEPSRSTGATALVSPADRAWLDAGYRESFVLPRATQPDLAAVVRDALDRPGRMVRAQLAFAVGRAAGLDRALARDLAIGIEYFHVASLIFDDLPAMDDAQVRRGRVCPHLVHGEGIAILGALALVNQGYALLWSVFEDLPGERATAARQLTAACLGAGGVLQGQALDLRFATGPADERAVLDVADGKTVSLVRLALVLPALAGGTATETVRRLDRLASVWGRSYQVLDDFKDCMADESEAGKTTARDAALRRPNLPLRVGAQDALRTVARLLREGRELLASFAGTPFADTAFVRLQRRLDRERRHVARRLPYRRHAERSAR